MNRFLRRPSPAMIVAIIALIAALGGTAIAGGVLTKKKVNKIITNRAPGLSVAKAKTADSAGTAGTAGTAQSPVAWAHIAGDGTVLASSSNITQANEDNPYGDGEYCFKGLGFAFKSLQATVDGTQPTDINIIAQVAIPDTLDCLSGLGFSGTQASVETTNANTGTIFSPAPFFVWFYN